MLRYFIRAIAPTYQITGRSASNTCFSSKTKVILCKQNENMNISTGNNSSNRFYASDHTEGNGVLVNHDSGANLFFADIPGKGRAFLEYEREDQLIRILHTEVPPELGGRGLGKILAKEALDFIAKNDLRAEIECEFVRDFVTKYDPKFIKYIRT